MANLQKIQIQNEITSLRKTLKTGFDEMLRFQINHEYHKRIKNGYYNRLVEKVCADARRIKILQKQKQTL